MEVSAAPTGSEAAPPASAAPDAEAVVAILAKLRPYVVTNERFARRTLYTWTTRDQIEDLEKHGVLLTRTESPVHGPAYSDQVISARAAAGDRLAKLLTTAPFRRARHAWPAPYATLLGWPSESYGSELIRIDLKSDAWIAKLQVSTKEWSVVDLDEHPVAIEEVLRAPQRLAAVYFVQDDTSPARVGGTFGRKPERPAYREYVVCNESMIERWSVGTEEIARELVAEVEMLSLLRPRMSDKPGEPIALDAWNAQVAQRVWPKGADLEGSVRATYEATLSFPNELYRSEAIKIAALSEKMRLVTTKGPVLSRTPSVRFGAAPAVTPPPPPPKRRRSVAGTY
ncbi:Hypothetical protein A7982_10335 [Minicystis rosea]|nr:Hypothetical protein A7982_10335 [Minicystis rosea]